MGDEKNPEKDFEKEKKKKIEKEPEKQTKKAPKPKKKKKKGNRCRILWAKNGKEAIELYRNNSVDLILLDIKMPEMNGIEALKEIRKLSADIPIIMQTAYAFDSDKDIAIEAGCTGFITKPINPVVLKQTISNYISGIIW